VSLTTLSHDFAVLLVWLGAIAFYFLLAGALVSVFGRVIASMAKDKR